MGYVAPAAQKFTAALKAKGSQLTYQTGSGILVFRVALTDPSLPAPPCAPVPGVVPQAGLPTVAPGDLRRFDSSRRSRHRPAKPNLGSVPCRVADMQALSKEIGFQPAIPLRVPRATRDKPIAIPAAPWDAACAARFAARRFRTRTAYRYRD
jgi:hypothetical protein